MKKGITGHLSSCVIRPDKGQIMFKDFFVFPEYNYGKEFAKLCLISQLVRDMSKRTYLTDEDKNVLKDYLVLENSWDVRFTEFKHILLIRKIFPMAKAYST